MHKLKSMLMKKLDSFADYYENKELKDINPTAVNFMVKATETLQNISTIEAMDEYGDQYDQYMDEMSGVPRRSPRTGRFVSRDDGMSGRMYPMYTYDDGYGREHRHESYNDGYGHGGSYNDGYSHDSKKAMLKSQLEETMRTSRNEEEREAARKMLKAMEGTN